MTTGLPLVIADCIGCAEVGITWPWADWVGPVAIVILIGPFAGSVVVEARRRAADRRWREPDRLERE